MTLVRIAYRPGRRLRSRRGAVTAMSAPATGRAQSAFRIQQEDAGGDDALSFSQPSAGLDAIRELHAKRDRSRLEPVTKRDKHVLLFAGINHGVTRHCDHCRSSGFE